MMLAVALLVLASAPGLQLEGCADGWLDVRQVSAQLRLDAAVPDGAVVVQCLPDSRVRLTRAGWPPRELTLSSATAAQRERTLALLIAAWLERAEPGLSPVDGGARNEAHRDAGSRVRDDLAENARDAGSRPAEPKQAGLPRSTRDAGSTDAQRAEFPRSARDAGSDAQQAALLLSTSDTGASTEGTAREGTDTLRPMVTTDAGARAADATQVSAATSRDAGLRSLDAEEPATDAGALALMFAPDGGSLEPPAPESFVPIELGLVPGIGLNRLFPFPARNFLAIGLLGVSSPRLDGLSFGLISVVDVETRGLQLGAVTLSGETRGLQLGGAFANTSGSLVGGQLGLLTRAGRDAWGVQLGALALAGPVRGAQWAVLASFSEDVVGWQLGGLLTSSTGNAVGAQTGVGWNRVQGELRGLQLGAVNSAGTVSGVQLGLINVAGDVTGLQLGALNIAQRVTGMQVGVVNVATEGTATLGAVSINESRPMRVAFTVGDTNLFNVSLKSGGSWLYGVASAGWVPRAAARGGGGLGLHLGSLTEAGLFGEFELLAHAVVNLEAPAQGVIVSTSLGFHFGFRIAPRIAFLLGPQVSLLIGNPAFPGRDVSLFGIPLNAGGLAIAPGAQFGVEI